jgi:hypothetical protein
MPADKITPRICFMLKGRLSAAVSQFFNSLSEHPSSEMPADTGKLITDTARYQIR